VTDERGGFAAANCMVQRSSALRCKRQIGADFDALALGLAVVFRLLYSRFAMRTSTFPPIRVEPEIRAQTEAVLREGESLTQFIEDAVRKEVEWRAAQAAFVARGQAALEEHEELGGPALADVKARMQQRATRGTERIRAAVTARARTA
jgi:hypothetical protein